MILKLSVKLPTQQMKLAKLEGKVLLMNSLYIAGLNSLNQEISAFKIKKDKVENHP